MKLSLVGCSCFTSLILLAALPNCTHKQPFKKAALHLHAPSEKTVPVASAHKPPVTVWIHGTKLLISATYHSVFAGKPGLKHACLLPRNNYLHTIARTLSTQDPEQFPFEHFYIFGWSGKLCARERQDVARTLHTRLQEISTQYEQVYREKPIIRIIGHSHGASVALNLANIEEKTIDIDELILLACPVQECIYSCVRNPMFKKIFSLYSTLDIAQIIAPQITRYTAVESDPMWNRLRFPPISKREFPPQENLVQTKVKINKHALTHGEFMSKKFLTTFAHVRKQMATWLAEQRDASTSYTHLLHLHFPKGAVRRALANAYSVQLRTA